MTMTIVLAAVTDDETATAVLDAAAVIAPIYSARIVAVHVREPGTTPPEEVCRRASVELRLVDGNVSDELVTAIRDDEVGAAVLGAMARQGHPKPGHVTLEVASRVVKPVFVVPPEARIPRPGERLRILVPLDGTDDAALTARAALHRLAGADAELVVLHVFDPELTPLFLDRPEHDLPVWAHEFMTRYCDVPGCSMRWRSGTAGAGISDAATDEGVDAVVLSWTQRVAPGRARAVREVLGSAGVPVVLVPRAAAERLVAAAEGVTAAGAREDVRP
jgi:hypothetical protein